jgi:hypothetical protein
MSHYGYEEYRTTSTVTIDDIGRLKFPVKECKSCRNAGI